MSKWSGKIFEKNYSQNFLSMSYPFGVQVYNFVTHFQKSSKRFVIEILNTNLVLNLSGTLFFMGLGCSLKWWYKDQLFIILLKQNLPAFNEPQQKLSWETGEYVLKKQNSVFAKQTLRKPKPYMQVPISIATIPASTKMNTCTTFGGTGVHFSGGGNVGTNGIGVTNISKIRSYTEGSLRLENSFMHLLLPSIHLNRPTLTYPSISSLHTEVHFSEDPQGFVLQADDNQPFLSYLMRTKYSFHSCASSLRTQEIGRMPRAYHYPNFATPVPSTGHPTYGMEAVLRTQEVQFPTEGKQATQGTYFCEAAEGFLLCDISKGLLFSYPYPVRSTAKLFYSCLPSVGSCTRQSEKSASSYFDNKKNYDGGKTFQNLFERLDLYMNNIVVKFKPPWQKHTYQRFVGLFSAPSVRNTDFGFTTSDELVDKKGHCIHSLLPVLLPTATGACLPEGCAQHGKVSTNGSFQKKFSIYTTWKPLLPKMWFKLSARNLCLLKDELPCNILQPTARILGEDWKFFTFFRKPIICSLFSVTSLQKMKNLLPAYEVQLPTDALCCAYPCCTSSIACIAQVGIAQGKHAQGYATDSLRTQGRSSGMHRASYRFPAYAGKKHRHGNEAGSTANTCYLVSQSGLLRRIDSGNKKQLGLENSFTIKMAPNSNLIDLYSVILSTKLTKLRAILEKSKFSSLKNGSLHCVHFSGGQEKKQILPEKKQHLFFPLELTKTMVGWQPPSNALLLNSYLDEIPYKLESVLHFVTPFIYTTAFVENQVINSKAYGDTIHFHRDIQQTILATFLASHYEVNRQQRKGICLPFGYSEKSKDSQIDSLTDPTKIYVQSTGIRRICEVADSKQCQLRKPFRYGKEESETFLRKAQLLEMKELLKQELQFLIPTLNLVFVDPSIANEHSNVENNSNRKSQNWDLKRRNLRLFKNCIRVIPNELEIGTNTPIPLSSELSKLRIVSPITAVPPKAVRDLSQSMQKITAPIHTLSETWISNGKKKELTELVQGTEANRTDKGEQNQIWDRSKQQAISFQSKNNVKVILENQDQTTKNSSLNLLNTSINPLFLLNNLGFTFNNLSSLNSPPILLPINSDASFWMWNFPSFTKSKHLIFKQNNKKFPSPQNATTNNTIFHLHPKSFTWEIFQQPNDEQPSFTKLGKKEMVHVKNCKKKINFSWINHTPKNFFQQKITTITKTDSINIVDRGINFGNKRSRFMSGYVYPDLQSQSLKTYFYQWLNTNKIEFNKQRALSTVDTWVYPFLPCLPLHTCAYPVLPSVCTGLAKQEAQHGYVQHGSTHRGTQSSGFAKLGYATYTNSSGFASLFQSLTDSFTAYTEKSSNKKTLAGEFFDMVWELRSKTSIDSLTKESRTLHFTGDPELTQQNEMYWLCYPESFRGINRLLDNACLSNIEIPITPTIFPPVPPLPPKVVMVGQGVQEVEGYANIDPLTDSTKMYVQSTGNRRKKSGQSMHTSACLPCASHGYAQYGSILLPYEKFNHRLAFFPGFAKPSQFFLTLPEISQGNYVKINAQDNFLGNNLTPVSKTPVTALPLRSDTVTDSIGRSTGAYGFTSRISGIDKFLIDCNARGTAYRGIVIQRNKLTKDLQPFKETLGQSSTWSILLLGPENPLTDRQCHFFGQKQLSTLDANNFQRDYVQQLGKEIVAQVNRKGFTEKLPSIERTKILSLSKTVNSFFLKKRKYAYLLEKTDHWHLLFQEQLRTALEDTRKYPPLTPEETKNNGLRSSGRIKISAPLIITRFPKEIAKTPLSNLSVQHTSTACTTEDGNGGNSSTGGNGSIVRYAKEKQEQVSKGIQKAPLKQKMLELQHGMFWRPFCYVKPSCCLSPRIITKGIHFKGHFYPPSYSPANSYTQEQNEKLPRQTGGRIFEKNKTLPSLMLETNTYPYFSSSKRAILPCLPCASHGYAQVAVGRSTGMHNVPQRVSVGSCTSCVRSIASYGCPVLLPTKSGSAEGMYGICDNLTTSCLLPCLPCASHGSAQVSPIKKTIYHYPLLTERQSFELTNTPWRKNIFSSGMLLRSNQKEAGRASVGGKGIIASFSTNVCASSYGNGKQAHNQAHALILPFRRKKHRHSKSMQTSFSVFNVSRNVTNNLQWLIQEPLTANSWAVICQWFFLIALLFWIEQMFLRNIFPALFALEQILLGTTGIKTSDRTHIIRVSKPLVSNTPKFQNLAGVDGLLGELSELVLFLRGHKERLWNKKSSHGVLLTGPPGTGKTFLVRALANEARVPVLILSAGTLVASKFNTTKPSWAIRHAFRRAKQLAPCILFIDEIDALGKSRGKIVTDSNEIIASTFSTSVPFTRLATFEGGVAYPSTMIQNQTTRRTVETNVFFSGVFSYQQSWPSVSDFLLNEWEHPLKSLMLMELNQINRYSICEDKLFDLVKSKGYSKISANQATIVSNNKLEERGTNLKSSSQFRMPSADLRGLEKGTAGMSTDNTRHSPNAVNNGENMTHNVMENGKDNQRKFGPLTQLLVSMDGVSNLSGILIMGATNRPELLDSALTRPGRFERIIRIEKPSEQKRIEILQLYSHNLGVQHQIPWHYLSNRTRGLTAADLAVAMNYSSLKAIIQGSTHTIETIEYGLNSITRFINIPFGHSSFLHC